MNNYYRLLELSGVKITNKKPQIVEIKTKDNITLHGLYIPSNKDNIFINIHGTASNFYDEPMIGDMTKRFPEIGWAFLSTNNRGHDILTGWDKKQPGDATELFEDCLLDIDAWIKFAKDLGYKNIILSGHSLGSEKVVYYMNKGTYINNIIGIVLLGPADSFEYQNEFMRDNQLKQKLFEEAKTLIKNNKGYQFLSSYWFCHFNVLPQSASSFLNFFEDGSELSKVLPFKRGSLPMVKNIKIPILSVIGNIKEYTVIPVDKAMTLLKKENYMCETHILNCDHDFDGEINTLCNIIVSFMEHVEKDR
jgi:hypothetical protein